MCPELDGLVGHPAVCHSFGARFHKRALLFSYAASARKRSPTALAALKIAPCLEMRHAGITRMELARRLGVDEKEVRRMLDPYHPTKADRLEKALAVFGKQIKLRVA